MSKIILLLSLIVSSALPATRAGAQALAPRRMALVIGANAAAPGRKPLRYSHADAEAVRRVLEELGGFSHEDISILLDPDPERVLTTIDAQLGRARRARQEAVFVFYYSGHADATALYPNGKPLALSNLRTRLSSSLADVRVGIIDACRGGGWTGTKGLSETEPFEVDLPTALASEGSVLIASSSGLEDAHESESLGGSFFTHHWIAALRGAGDRNADGEVTLTEAFDYARTLTIRDTALYTSAPQHPSFSMQLRGRLPMTSIGGASAVIAVDQRRGPLELVHLGSGVVVLEIPQGERSMRLAVAPGTYVLRRRDGNSVWAQELVVAAGQVARVDEAHLTLVGSSALLVKNAAPRPVTLSTLPRGKQEITAWLGISHGSAVGGQLELDDDAQLGFIAPRGLTDRWQWVLPGLGFVYRGGELGAFEWLPWGGVPGWGAGYGSFEGFILTAQPGLGLDLRKWLTARSSFDFSLGAWSGLRWTSKDPDDAFTIPKPVDSQSMNIMTDTPQWVPPTTWRSVLSLGYTHTLADTVTLNLSLSIAQTQLFEARLANHDLSSEQSDLVLSIGGVQAIGLRPTPLIRVHVSDRLSLNANTSVSYHFARERIEEAYFGGASFIW